MEEDKIFRIPITDINVRTRQREDLGNLETLQIDITQNGLIQPIVVEQTDEGLYFLLAGNRRLNACKNLQMTHMPCVLRKDMDDLTRMEIEYSEDHERKNRTWVETVTAQKALLKAYQSHYGQGLPARFGKGQKQLATQLGISETQVSQNLQLADMLETNPELGEIETRRDALRRMRNIKNNVIEPEKRKISVFQEQFIHQSFKEGIASLDPDSIDLLVTDLTDMAYLESVQLLIPVLAPLAHAFVFFPLKDFPLFSSVLGELDLNYRESPYIWHCLGSNNFQAFMWFSKELREPPKFLGDHLAHRQEEHALHERAKGYHLLENLVKNTTLQGQFVLDPVCYGTSLVKVCVDLGRNIMCYCPQKELHGQIIINLEGNV